VILGARNGVRRTTDRGHAPISVFTIGSWIGAGSFDEKWGDHGPSTRTPLPPE